MNRKVGAAPAWHSLPTHEVLSRQVSSRDGLTGEEALRRLAQIGLNELPAEPKSPAWKLFLSQFMNPLMYIMTGAVLVSLFLGHVSDTIFIVAVLLSNAVVGFWQEHKANKSLQVLKNAIKPRVRVVRAGSEHEVDASTLVPGDIILLRAGDRVPADARVIECDNCRVNEASLTGESRPVEKETEPTRADAELGDRSSMIFMGTVMEEGWARAAVVTTGMRTEYGDIVALLKETPEEPTPLQATVASLSKIIGIFIGVLVGVLIIEGYWAGRAVEETFAAALALLISAIPEGLLPAITIVLALGMHRILKQKGLVRRLAATETLGGVTVICTDKTGTLTEGRMKAERILTSLGDVSQVGLARQKGDMQLPALLTIRIAALSNDGYVENPDARGREELVVRGNLTEQSLWRLAHQVGLRKQTLEEQEPSLDTLFFSSERKYSASLRRFSEDADRLYVVGAPERVLAKARALEGQRGELPLPDRSFDALRERMESLVKQGFRVVACAYRSVPRAATYEKLEDLVDGLTLAGCIALDDPIREDVPGAFQQTTRAGIRTVVVTGDHKWTAAAVARQVGLAVGEHEVLEGHEIEAMSDAELRRLCGRVALYARVSPRHKLRIVHALQSQGEVVAMFGDGVNDAPALKAANIGVAVGTEVDAVREVADLVLLRSGFSTIVSAIEQGRIIFDNIRRVFLYLIVQDFSQFFLFMCSLALGLPLPLIAAQLLMVNLVESGLPDLALTTEQEKRGVMHEPPRAPGESVLNGPAARFMMSVFAISGGIAAIFYMWAYARTGDIELTRTMVMLLMCMESLLLAFSLRSFRQRLWRSDIFANRWLTGAVFLSFGMVVLAIYFEPLQNLLSTVPLTAEQWMTVLAANILEIALIDAMKLRIFRRRSNKNNAIMRRPFAVART